MTDFKAPIDDMLFSLKHIAGADSLPGWDEESLREIASHHAAFVESEIAPLNSPGDLQGARLMDGRVVLPDGFKEAYQAYAEQGWQGLVVPEAYGGHALDDLGLDDLALALTSETMSGANHAFQMLGGLAPGLVRVLLKFGTEEQRQRYLPAIASGKSLSTMALTEPGAGSDLSRIKCTATQTGENWLLSGEKIFISNGDQDASETTTHLVLARTSDEGVKGLSLFLCPAHLPDGSRNAVQVLRIEHKMGIKASPTCHMLFDSAQAEIIGEPGQGLKLMFEMMNHARLDVALQGVAHASRAGQIAGDYAAERVQGGVAIDQHPDVQRMLDEIHMLALGARGLAHLAYVELIKADKPDLVELLTHLAKVYCSNAGVKAADLAMQVLGGYGYLQEYQVEQIYRDARICQIYEGANGIHELALVTRQLKKTTPYVELAEVLSADESLEMGMDEEVEDLLAVHSMTSALEDPRAVAHEFSTLVAETILTYIWQKAELAASQHPEPSRIDRLTDRAYSKRYVALEQFKMAYPMDESAFVDPAQNETME